MRIIYDTKIIILVWNFSSPNWLKNACWMCKSIEKHKVCELVELPCASCRSPLLYSDGLSLWPLNTIPRRPLHYWRFRLRRKEYIGRGFPNLRRRKMCSVPKAPCDELWSPCLIAADCERNSRRKKGKKILPLKLPMSDWIYLGSYR